MIDQPADTGSNSANRLTLSAEYSYYEVSIGCIAGLYSGALMSRGTPNGRKRFCDERPSDSVCARLDQFG